MRKNKTWNLLPILIGALIFISFVVFKFDLSKFVLTVSENISWSFYILISFMITLQLLCRTLRFNLLFNHVFEDGISLKDSFLLTGASFFVAMATPNKLGDAARGLFFRRKGIEITAVALIEYLFDTLIIAGIAVLALTIVCRQYLNKLVIIPGVLVLGTAVLFYLFRYGKAEKFVNRFSWFRRIHGRVKLLKSHFTAGIRSKFVLSTGFIFSVFFIAIYFLIFYMVLCQLGADVSIANVLLCAGAGMFIGSLTFIPMGMGTRDVSTYGLLCSVGVEPAIAISSVIIMRSLSISLLLVSGLCYFLAVNLLMNKDFH